MSEQPAYIAQGTPSATNLPVDTIARASPEIATSVSTAISSATTTTLVVASGALPFPQSGSFAIRALTEEMLVTGGQGTTSWTVTRGINGTTALASIPVGTAVSLLVAVQRVEPVYAKKQISYMGRCGTFLIPGRGGTASQNLAMIFNASGSAVLVDVDTVLVGVSMVAANLSQPPTIRLYKITAVPTNGAALTKVPEDSSLTTNASVTVLQDASGDNTGATTTLTSTPTAGNVWAQVQGAQWATLVGYSPIDSFRFFPGGEEFVTLRAAEGLLVRADYTASVQNPAGNRWTVDFRWVEYTNAG